MLSEYTRTISTLRYYKLTECVRVVRNTPIVNIPRYGIHVVLENTYARITVGGTRLIGIHTFPAMCVHGG